jgi:hypothetical protein
MSSTNVALYTRASSARHSDRRFGDVDDTDLGRLEDLLVEHALEHDSPTRAAAHPARTLLERQLLRPGVSTLERLVASAGARAERETHERLSPLLDDAARRSLDALGVTDIALGVSQLVWLAARRPRRSRRRSFAQLEKLAFLRELGATGWDLDVVAANRRRQLAALARRSTTAAGARTVCATPPCCASVRNRSSGSSTRSSIAPIMRSAKRTARRCASS